MLALLQKAEKLPPAMFCYISSEEERQKNPNPKVRIVDFHKH